MMQNFEQKGCFRMFGVTVSAKELYFYNKRKKYIFSKI